MRKLRLIFCGLMLSVALVGCGGSKSENNGMKYEIIGNRTFLVIDTSTGFSNVHLIYVDKETKVQYLMFEGGHWGIMSVLLDADGKPILYDGEV